MERMMLSPREMLERDFGQLAIDLLQRVDRMASIFADPEDVIKSVIRFMTADQRTAIELRSLWHDPIALDCLVRLAGCSRFGLGIAIFDYGQFWSVVQDRHFRHVLGRREMTEDWGCYLPNHPSLDGRVNALLRFQHHHLLRIMLGDIMGDWTLSSITREISDLADVCIQAAFELAVWDHRQRYGDMPGTMSIFSMGKLGARELNYSSDIDLIFVYEVNEAGPNAVDPHEYFCRLGQDIIRLLDSSFPKGRLYRVDMRLRPEGESGELALSKQEVIDYCYAVGRSWERQAWIKARVSGGDAALGDDLRNELRPWIYPSHPRWDQLKDAGAMRLRIEERAAEDDVKIGSGGIRDIEFLAQYYQLGWGGRIPELQQRGTFAVLRALQSHGFLSREEHSELAEAYSWLRLVEHRLQMWESRQIHTLPDDLNQRRHVAGRCGYYGPNGLTEFDHKLNTVRERVRSLAQQHYLGTSDELVAAFALIHYQQVSSQSLDLFLDPTVFKDQQRAVKQIRSLAEEPFFLLSRSRTEHALAELLPALLADLSTAPDPDKALRNFVRMVDSVGGRAMFYEHLLRHEDTRRRFVHLAGWAHSLVDLLVGQPGLADEVVERLQRGQLDRQQMMSELQSILRGQTDILPILRFYHSRELVAVAIEDLDGMAPWAISRDLSDLARVILQSLLSHHAQLLADKWGWPVMKDGRVERCTILGLGKAGSGELSYSSDLDVIFLADGGGKCPDGAHDGDQFWGRVLQRVMRDCTDLRLYEVDIRLRPWGDQGSLIVTRQAMRSYWSRHDDLWERLAYTRVGYFCGDESLAEEIMDFLGSILFEAPLPQDALTQMVQMRQRLEQSVEGKDHVKRGYGGYVDVEFIAQFGLLGGLHTTDRLPVFEPRHTTDGLSSKARELIPALVQDLRREPGDGLSRPFALPIAEAVQFLLRQGVICSEAAADFLVALALLRWIESRMRLYAGCAVSSLPTDQVERQAFARCAGYITFKEMDQDLHLVRERCRFWFVYYAQE